MFEILHLTFLSACISLTSAMFFHHFQLVDKPTEQHANLICMRPLIYILKINFNQYKKCQHLIVYTAEYILLAFFILVTCSSSSRAQDIGVNQQNYALNNLEILLWLFKGSQEYCCVPGWIGAWYLCSNCTLSCRLSHRLCTGEIGIRMFEI